MSNFYRPIVIEVFGKPCICYFDIGAKKSYNDIFYRKELIEYLKKTLQKSFVDVSTYCILYLWGDEQSKMIDIWQMRINTIDDISGPLSDMMVLRDGIQVMDLGIASGNTLIILGLEEIQRRSSLGYDAYILGLRPTYPLQICNELEYFTS